MTAARSPKPMIRTGLRLFVWALIAIALIYFGRAVAHHWSSIAAWHPGYEDWAMVLAAIGLCTLNLFMQAEIWHRLVLGCQDKAFARPITYASYTKTQIAKYLPGNVFQFVGRHIVMAQRGAAQKGLALASLVEIATLAGAAALLVFGGLVLGLLPQIAALLEAVDIGWLAIAGVIMAGLAAAGLAIKLKALPPLPSFGVMLTGLALAMVFFIGLSLVFLLILRTVSGEGDMAVIAIVVLSWLIGYITPGAPAGIGIREFVMLFLLREHVPEPDALIAIGLFRLVTSVSDFALFALGQLMWRDTPATAQSSGN
ncbi:MAG: lysylphosphatidylglycerol synthase domain-containing protein [Pseudomonadota bacterium]